MKDDLEGAEDAAEKRRIREEAKEKKRSNKEEYDTNVARYDQLNRKYSEMQRARVTFKQQLETQVRKVLGDLHVILRKAFYEFAGKFEKMAIKLFLVNTGRSVDLKRREYIFLAEQFKKAADEDPERREEYMKAPKKFEFKDTSDAEP